MFECLPQLMQVFWYHWIPTCSYASIFTLPMMQHHRRRRIEKEREKEREKRERKTEKQRENQREKY